MEVVWHEGPGEAPGSGLDEDGPEPIEEQIPVPVIEKYRLPIDTTGYDMVECTGKVDSGGSWHDTVFPLIKCSL